MLASLQMIMEKYGGAEGHARQVCGLSDTDIESIRWNMLSEEKPILP